MSPSAAVVAIVVYVLGIVLLTIGFGFFNHPKSELRFDTSDYVLFTILVLLWPLLLVVGVFVVLPVAAAGHVVCFVVKWLMNVGEGIYCWWEERKEAREVGDEA